MENIQREMQLTKDIEVLGKTFYAGTLVYIEYWDFEHNMGKCSIADYSYTGIDLTLNDIA